MIQMLLRFLTRQTAWYAAVAFLAIAFMLCDIPGSRAQSSEQPASEMLQDGLDALGEKQTDLATQLFEQLILAYPGTGEADRAEHELVALGGARPSPRDEASREAPDNEPAIVSSGRDANQTLRTKFAVEVGDRVFFAEDSAVIGGRARSLIESQARWLKRQPALKITIVGRADDGGTADEERTLSAKRAEAVRDKLVAAGVPISLISIDARAASDPVATCRTTLCQAQNRQAETVLTGPLPGGSPLGAAERLPSGDGLSRSSTISDAVGGRTVSR